MYFFHKNSSAVAAEQHAGCSLQFVLDCLNYCLADRFKYWICRERARSERLPCVRGAGLAKPRLRGCFFKKVTYNPSTKQSLVPLPLHKGGNALAIFLLTTKQ